MNEPLTTRGMQRYIPVIITFLFVTHVAYAGLHRVTLALISK